ncbi:MAG: hypothetical protein J6K05_05440 [Bacteroidaceae bacterium]|nr:hypothetical protein [Bacteroidaceae bacterium]MBP3552598.1 hypothetical protein [Bacteroidaceae bacterium]
MNFESFEKIESLSLSEVIDDCITPLEERSFKNSGTPFERLPNLEDSLFSSEHLEFLTDLEMTESIADYLESVEELKFDKWVTLSIEQKAKLLNDIEQNIASIEHRPALRVELEDLEPRSFGYQDEDNHKIVLNSRMVGLNSVPMHREVIDTIVHEGRHAYQHYNVDVKCIHESAAEVSTWRDNFYDPEYKYYQSTGQRIMIRYNDGSVHNVDFRLYYQQPVETDARNFAKDVMIRLEERGVIAREAECNQKQEISNINTEGTHANGNKTLGTADLHESLQPLPPPKVELIPETKAVMEFMQKMENNEVGPNDKLLGTTSGYPIWDNTHDKFMSMELLDDNIKVYKDDGTGRLFVQTSTGYTSPLEKTNLWEPEGFSYAYRDIFGNDVAVKTIKTME